MWENFLALIYSLSPVSLGKLYNLNKRASKHEDSHSIKYKEVLGFCQRDFKRDFSPIPRPRALPLPIY